MTNITSLQEKLSQSYYWKEKPAQVLIGLYGSGLDTVLIDFVKNNKTSSEYVYINCLDVVLVDEYNSLRHIFNEILDQKKLALKDISLFENDYYALYGAFVDLLKNELKEKRIIIILDHFERLASLATYFFDSLARAQEVIQDTCEVKYLFAVYGYIDQDSAFTTWGELYKDAFNNVDFINGFSINEIAEVLKPTVDNNTEVAHQMYKMTAGNPAIVDRLLDIIAQDIKEKGEYELKQDMIPALLDDFDIFYHIKKIWSDLSKSMRKDVKEMSIKENLYLNSKDFKVRFLEGTGVVSEQKLDLYNLNFDLLRVYLDTHTRILEPKVDIKEKRKDEKKPLRKVASSEESKSINTDSLSPQEYTVYEKLSQNPGTILTKEEIAKILWGKNLSDKKSKWAIDQLVKRMRDKLGAGVKIQTVRGRGYKFGK